LPSALEAVPMEQRSTIRDVSHALQIPKSTVHRMVRVDKVIRPHTSAVKPLLTDQAKFVRLMYAASRIEPKQGGGFHYKAAFDEFILMKSGSISPPWYNDSTSVSAS
jgi:hypothetical protein